MLAVFEGLEVEAQSPQGTLQFKSIRQFLATSLCYNEYFSVPSSSFLDEIILIYYVFSTGDVDRISLTSGFGKKNSKSDT